jgi:RNA polymerase sigma-70 factor (ECF subfamily)
MGMGAPGGSPEDSPGDGALIVASVAEPGRFGELFDRHADEIYRYVARRLGPDVATDLVAEVFLIAFRNRGSFDPGRAQARPWLYGIAVNVIRGHRRTETRRLRTLAQAPWPGGTDSERFEDRVVERVSAQRLRPALARALGTLSAAERDLLLLVAWGDLSYDQAAQALGIPGGTARSRLARLRAKLRKSLESATETTLGTRLETSLKTSLETEGESR